MEISISKLLEGKGTTIKNKEYFPTKQYVNQFIDEMYKITDKFIVKVKLPDQITTGDITYNKVFIQAILPSNFDYKDYNQTINMVYGLDITKPVCKFFKTGLSKDNEINVFDYTAISLQNIEERKELNYSPINNLLYQSTIFSDRIKWLENITIDIDKFNKKCGEYINYTLTNQYETEFGKVKIASSIISDVYKNILIDSTSRHYNNSEVITYMDIYNCFSDLISNDKDKDIINKFEKMSMISKMILS